LSPTHGRTGPAERDRAGQSAAPAGGRRRTPTLLLRGPRALAVRPALYFFKVAFSTFKFKFGATLRRQAKRSDSEARHKAPNLT